MNHFVPLQKFVNRETIALSEISIFFMNISGEIVSQKQGQRIEVPVRLEIVYSLLNCLIMFNRV